MELRTVGRPAKPVVANNIRELNEADLAALSLERPSSGPPPIKQIRDSHHSVARCLASGLKPAQVSIITGYSPSRISILQADPAFKELLHLYKEEVDTAFADVQVRAKMVGMDYLQELHNRLLEAPEDISFGQILETVTKMLDRTGHGPSTKNTQVNVNIDLASRLQAARARVAALDADDLPSSHRSIDLPSSPGRDDAG